MSLSTEGRSSLAPIQQGEIECGQLPLGTTLKNIDEQFECLVGTEVRPEDIDGRFNIIAGSLLHDDESYRHLLECSHDRTVFIVWKGNQHLADFLFSPAVPFDFLVYGYEELFFNESVATLSESVITAYFQNKESDAELKSLLQNLKNVPGCRPVLVGTPPPKEDNDWLKRTMSSEAYWLQCAQIKGFDFQSLELSPPILRYKLWLVVQKMLKRAATENGIEFAPVPRAVQTQEGFLREEYWGCDATHAWGSYGDLVRDYLFRRYCVDVPQTG